MKPNAHICSGYLLVILNIPLLLQRNANHIPFYIHFMSCFPADNISRSQCWKPSSPFSNVHFRNTTKIAALLTFVTFTFEPFLKL